MFCVFSSNRTGLVGWLGVQDRDSGLNDSENNEHLDQAKLQSAGDRQKLRALEIQ